MVSRLVREAMRDHHLNAVIVKVSVDGEPVITRAFGESMTGVPATTGMRFRNGSVAIGYLANVLLQQLDALCRGESSQRECAAALAEQPGLALALERVAAHVQRLELDNANLKSQLEAQELSQQQAELREQRLHDQLQGQTQMLQSLQDRCDEQQHALQQCQQEARIWEVAQSTLTEGYWDFVVVNGRIDDPASTMRISNQFRFLMGYGRDELPDGLETQANIIHPDHLGAVASLFAGRALRRRAIAATCFTNRGR